MTRMEQFITLELDQMLPIFPSKVTAGLSETGPKVVLHSTLRAHDWDRKVTHKQSKP